MNIPPVLSFFTTKTTVQLKSGQKFEGLVSHIDHSTSTVTLVDVEDLGNEQDKHFVPHDKKIPEKQFQLDNISEIFTKEKHFSEPKKYKKQDFWDSTTEQQNKPQRYEGKDNRGGRGDRRDRGGDRGNDRGGDRGNDRGGDRGYYKKDYKEKRNYEQKPRDRQRPRNYEQRKPKDEQERELR